MTPAQLTKLARIRAACQRVLELESGLPPMANEIRRAEVLVLFRERGRAFASKEDCEFYALSRTLTPALARGMLAALDGLEEDVRDEAPFKKQMGLTAPSKSEARIITILNTFPDDV